MYTHVHVHVFVYIFINIHTNIYFLSICHTLKVQQEFNDVGKDKYFKFS